MKITKLLKIVFAVLGIAAGVYAIIAAFGVFGAYEGDYPTSYTFGADFYTEMYGVTRDATYNIYKGNQILQKGLGALLIAIGIADIAYFGGKLAGALNFLGKKPEPQQASAMPPMPEQPLSPLPPVPPVQAQSAQPQPPVSAQSASPFHEPPTPPAGI